MTARFGLLWCALGCATAASLAALPAHANATAQAAIPPAAGSAAEAPAAVTPGDAPVQIEATVSNPTPTFGERIELRVTLRYPSHIKVFFPSKPDLRPLLVDSRDPGRTERREAGGAVVETVIVPALAVRTGLNKLPAVEVPWHAADTTGGAGASGTVTLPPLRVTVKSQFAGDTAAQPAPLPAPRALVEENVPLEIGLLVAAMMALSALGTALALKFYRDRAARRAPKPRVPAHAVALGRLDAFERDDRCASGEPAAVFSELSEIMREYLGGRFRFHALDMTTTELLARLKPIPLRGVQHDEIRAFAELSDLVKFARVPASADELRSEARFVRKLVERTMMTGDEQEAARRAEAERLARQHRLRLQVMAPAALRMRAFAIDVFVGALAMALIAWVAVDTARQLLFDVALLILPLWLVVRDVFGAQSPGKTMVGLQIAENDDDEARPATGWIDEDGAELVPTARIAGAGQRLVRNLALAVPIAGLVVEAVTCMHLPEQRRLGDQWASTRVIDAQVATRRGRPHHAPSVLLIILAALLVLMPFAIGGRPG